MEYMTDSAEMLSHLICPAFLVKDGVITEANSAAARRMINTGASVYSIITAGAEDYAQYSSGKLYLQLTSGGANVTTTQYGHLFCMESIYELPELQVLALAAQHLRQPLSTAMVNTDSLLQSSTIQQDENTKKQLGQLNRSLYQLTRAVSNMSDAALNGNARQPNLETRDAFIYFNELLDKIQSLVAQADRQLLFKGLKTSVNCMIDADLLERAVLNLVSNAIKFSEKGSSIGITLRSAGKQLRLTVENKGFQNKMYQNLFSQFMREPGIEDGRHGIGLGLSIVRGAAVAHGGSVLLNISAKNSVQITLTISTEITATTIIKSPIKLIGGYSGGWDNYLIELSDILPDTLFESV